MLLVIILLVEMLLRVLLVIHVHFASVFYILVIVLKHHKVLYLMELKKRDLNNLVL